MIVRDRSPAGVHLEEVKTRELDCAHPDQEAAALREELQRRHIRHLPVVQDGHVLAIFSLRDLPRADLDTCTQSIQARVEPPPTPE